MLCVCLCVCLWVHACMCGMALGSTHPLDSKWFLCVCSCTFIPFGVCVHIRANGIYPLYHRAALCFCFIPSWTLVAGCKGDLFDQHHVWEHIDMCLCQSMCLHAHIPPYVFLYMCAVWSHVFICLSVCVCVCVCAHAHTHFQFPWLPPSQPMHTLILLDLVGLDQKLLMKEKEPSAWRLERQSRSWLY